MKNQLKRMISKKVADRPHFGSNIESLLYGGVSKILEGESLLMYE